jgi:hypothetical protein
MTDLRPQPKEWTCPDYVRANFDPSDRLAVLVRNSRRSEIMQRIASARRIAEPSFQEWLQYKNEQESSDIYISMNTLKPHSRTRTKEDIEAIRHLYADLDHDGPASLRAIRQSGLVPEPNFVLTTSPERFQVIWKVEGVLRDQAEPLLKSIARRFGGDPASTDSTRVLRLPGFANHKYESGFIVRAQQHSSRTYHLLDFNLRAEPVGSVHQPSRVQPSRTSVSEGRPLSQSEHDWAYANRALARGVDPEEVTRNIAEFRAQEKHDPWDYARRTVEKAQAQLNSRASRSESPREADGIEHGDK